MYIKIAGFIPDAETTTPGLLIDVNNMIPTVRGYAGVPSQVAWNLPALAAECRGAAFVTTLDNSSILFAGTQTKLYKGGATSWEDVSKSGDYTGSSSTRWVFTQQGNAHCPAV